MQSNMKTQYDINYGICNFDVCWCFDESYYLLSLSNGFLEDICRYSNTEVTNNS